MIAVLGVLKTIFLAIVALFIVGIAYLLFRHWQLTTHRKGEPHLLPSAIPYLGVALEMGKRPIEFLLECSKKTTEIFGILVAGQRFFIVTCPHSTLTVIQSNRDFSITEAQKPVMHNLFNLSEDLIESPNLDYDVLRKWFSMYLLNDKSLDLLCKRMMRKFSDIYQLLVVQRLSESSKGENIVPLYDFIARFIFHVAIGAIYNTEINNSPEKCDKLFDSFRNLDKVTALCVAGVPIKYLPEAFASLRYIQDTTSLLTNDLSELLERRGKYFHQFFTENPHIKDTVGEMNSPIFWASVSNSMPATFWMLFYIIQKPDLLQAIRQEIEKNIPNYERFYDSSFLTDDTRVKEEIITNEQLNSLLLVDACLTETLRLKSGSFIVRIITRDHVEIQLESGNKYKFRKGDRLALFAPIFHYDEEIFKNPEEFNPYRFVLSEDQPLEDRINAALGKVPLKKGGRDLNASSIYLAFGAGVTYCPGRKFIRSEVKLLFIFLILNLDFTFKGDPEKVVNDPSRGGIGVFPPLIDIDVEVHKRHSK